MFGVVVVAGGEVGTFFEEEVEAVGGGDVGAVTIEEVAAELVDDEDDGEFGGWPGRPGDVREGPRRRGGVRRSGSFRIRIG